MILSITLENARKLNDSFNLHPRTILSGRNGVGKTTIGDALAFVYTGCDSNGKPLPIHLIREDAEKMRIVVKLGAITLERTLTQKKNGTLKLIKEGVPPVTLTQEQLSSMMGCDRDTFLSATIAGFFMSLPIDKRTSVLRSFIAPIDKYAVLEEILGFPLQEEMKLSLGLEKKRTDLVRSALAGLRVSQEKEASKLHGQLSILEATQPPGEKPEVSSEKIDSLLKMKNAWETYGDRRNLWKKARASFDGYLAAKEEWDKTLRELEQQRDLIKIPDDTSADTSDLSRQIEAKRSLIKSLPIEPRINNSVNNMDRCPTCGQVVSEKYKSSIIQQNTAAYSNYEKERAEILHHNSQITKEIEWLETQINRAIEISKLKRKEANVAAQQLQEANRRIKAHLSSPIPEPVDPGPEPITPAFDKVDPQTLESAEATYREARNALAVWTQKSADFSSAQQRALNIREGLSKIESHIAYYKLIEDSLLELDSIIFNKYKECYKIRPGYEFILKEDGSLSVSTPFGSYDTISTGQKIVTDSYICEKIGNSLPKPTKFIFVDNKDLVSEELKLEMEQVVTAVVSDGDLEVKQG